jgi:cytidylate kinase
MTASTRASGRRRLVVALDGPGSSGKSSVGAAAAVRLGYRFCDTGLLYRALTWLALDRGLPLDDGPALASAVHDISLAADADGRLARVLAAGRDVTSAVHSAAVDDHVSGVARLPEVRTALLDRQRSIASAGGIIMAGRDIGTVVLPDADLKLYLEAAVEERARRRAAQRGLPPSGPEAAGILADLRRRDRTDATRAVAPLRIADDALIVNTDVVTFPETVDMVEAAVRDAEADAAAEAEGIGAADGGAGATTVVEAGPSVVAGPEPGAGTAAGARRATRCPSRPSGGQWRRHANRTTTVRRRTAGRPPAGRCRTTRRRSSG